MPVRPTPDAPDAAVAVPGATVAPPSSIGYGVVDPMPMPACADVASQIAATAAWTKTNGQKTLTVHLKGKPGPHALAFTGASGEAIGAKILSTSGAGTTMALVLAIDAAPPASASLMLAIRASCDRRPITVSLSIPALAADGGAPAVEVTTY